MSLGLLLVQKDRFVVVIQLNQLSVQNICFQQLEFSLTFDLKDDVLWLEISVDNLADTMQVVKTHESLLGNFSRNRNWNTLVVEPLDQSEQVASKYLEGHDRVAPEHRVVEELVKHL